MDAVWKFVFKIEDRFQLSMPKGARVLHAGRGPDNQIALWALVDPDAEVTIQKFAIFGTGHPISAPPAQAFYYVTTFFDAPYVWHLFRGRRRRRGEPWNKKSSKH